MTEFKHIQRTAQNLRVDPPRSAWKRIESRLDAHMARRKMHAFRAAGYAAAIILLVALCAFAAAFFINPDLMDPDHYAESVEELTLHDGDRGESIYDIQSVRQMSALMKDSGDY